MNSESSYINMLSTPLIPVLQIVDYCKEMKIEFNDNIVIYEYFAQIRNFIMEYEDGFKHDNIKIEKKFNKVAEDM